MIGLPLVEKALSLFVDWLWLESINYGDVFLKILTSNIAVMAIATLVIFLIILINLLFTQKTLLATRHRVDLGGVIELRPPLWTKFISPKGLPMIFILISLFFASSYGLSLDDGWQVYQKFLNKETFNLLDPIFQRDVGFYIFELPFYRLIYQTVYLGFMLALFITAFTYFLSISKTGLQRTSLEDIPGKVHLGILLACIIGLKAIGYYLDAFNILYSPEGVVFGAGYTDVYATLLGYRILPWIALITALGILISILRSRFKLAIGIFGMYFLASVVLLGVYPGIIQKFRVVPNELNRETPFIEHNIAFTRKAYKLDEIPRQEFPAEVNLNRDKIENNNETINNIRVWAWETLKNTYSQLQELRGYYELADVDVDRYLIDGKYQQVMLSAREINQAQLPSQAQTWVNQTLKYTHGYGVVMSPVNQASSEGMPKFFIQDIPPKANVDIEIKRPEIYFGEVANPHVIVNSLEEEFDYPMGETNAFTKYQGTAGIKLDSFLKRILYAWHFKDYKILFAGQITSDSRILYNRNLGELMPLAMPFLRYDQDPYIVIHEGRLVWMWDAYTFSGAFPYSEPLATGVNYLRNSVKITVDAYDGSVQAYIADSEDPLIKSYAKMFPGVFKPIEEMPKGLQAHIRYPEDFFMAQAKMYGTYHMGNPQVFYNQEDRWTIPEELFGREQQQINANYVVMKLPGEKEAEYILMLPYTHYAKPYMVSWLAARSDGENYGELIAYTFPKDKVVYGPMQIEAQINNDSNISQQLNLWDQRGSQVIRGNLLTIPIENSILYVEPIYLQAEQSKLPQLRRVIVAYGDRIVMEETLEEALKVLFGRDTTKPPAKADGSPAPTNIDDGAQPPTGTVEELINEANRLFSLSQERLRTGDWQGYGESQKRLAEILNQLQSLSGKAQE